jgi:putative addiction module killer protein
MQTTFEIKEFTESGNSPFGDWHASLDAVTRARIEKYIRRLEVRNFGSVKALQEGVFELKMDFGPGYRIYFGRDAKRLSFYSVAAASDDNPQTSQPQSNAGRDKNN